MTGVEAAAPGMSADQRTPWSGLKDCGVFSAGLEPFISGPRQLFQSAAESGDVQRIKIVKYASLSDFITLLRLIVIICRKL